MYSNTRTILVLVRYRKCTSSKTGTTWLYKVVDATSVSLSRHSQFEDVLWSSCARNHALKSVKASTSKILQSLFPKKIEFRTIQLSQETNHWPWRLPKGITAATYAQFSDRMISPVCTTPVTEWVSLEGWSRWKFTTASLRVRIEKSPWRWASINVRPRPLPAEQI